MKTKIIFILLFVCTGVFAQQPDSLEIHNQIEKALEEAARAKEQFQILKADMDEEMQYAIKQAREAMKILRESMSQLSEEEAFETETKFNQNFERLEQSLKRMEKGLLETEERLQNIPIESKGNEKSTSDTTSSKREWDFEFQLGDSNYKVHQEKDSVKKVSIHKNPRYKTYGLTWWNGIDVGVNGIIGSNYEFNLSGENAFLEPDYSRSRYIGFNFGQAKARIIKDYVGITTGLSVQFYNYRYRNSHEFSFIPDSMLYFPVEDKTLYKNKLRVTYLAVPVLLEFNTSDKASKSFHVSAGVVGKLQIGQMYKQKYYVEGRSHKAKVGSDIGFNRWAADATVRVGYGHVTLFAQTGLLPLFKKANVDDVYNFSAGLFIKI